jgi:hypothetical protein
MEILTTSKRFAAEKNVKKICTGIIREKSNILIKSNNVTITS